MIRKAIGRALLVVISFFASLNADAQNEIDFTNKVSFSKTGNMSGIRLITLMPAPVTNEYQEICFLQANYGNFIDLNAANKVLFFDGSFEGSTFDVFESFTYMTKKVKIDFNNKTSKNVITGINPNDYLGSDGTYIDTNNNSIKQIGNQLWSQSENILDYAKRCYEYVASHYRYINGSWRTLKEIIQIGGGECGDFTTLFVNLMRYKGIPARHNMGVWVNGGYHVWPDFYHEDYGWVPVDPTFKNSNPSGDFFGRYDGNLVILSQGLTTFSQSGINVQDVPLQTFYYWYWYNSGSGNISGVHKTSMDYQVDGINMINANERGNNSVYNLQGIKQSGLRRGINIVNGKKILIQGTGK